MNDRQTTGVTGGGIGIAGIVTIIFVVLKLIGLISWPWILVFSPIWIVGLFLISMVVVVLIIQHFFFRD